MPALDGLLDFTLPADREAHEPPEARGLNRDDVRLLVSRRWDNTIAHERFTQLPTLLSPGDLVVVNDSGTLPAEVTAHNGDGLAFAFRFSTQLPDGSWIVEPRDVHIKAGEIVALPDNASATLVRPYRDSHRLWQARLDTPGPIVDYIFQWGHPIRYPYLMDAWPIDMYRTVYQGEYGSAEMPSAGRPFTCRLVDDLRRAEVGFATLTLHTGVSSLEHHEAPYEEVFRVSEETARMVNEVKAAKGRVIAVGTTVVRALETVGDTSGRVRAAEGWTDLVITPARGVHVVDGLLTGFHEPKATHLAMLEAIAGRRHLELAYRAAIEGRYLWHEFGDLHLII